MASVLHTSLTIRLHFVSLGTRSVLLTVVNSSIHTLSGTYYVLNKYLWNEHMGQWSSSLCFLTFVSHIASQCLRSSKHLYIHQVSQERNSYSFIVFPLTKIMFYFKDLTALTAECLLII